MFRTGDKFLTAVTDGGVHTQWVQNVRNAGGCEVCAGGRSYRTRNPRVYRVGPHPGTSPVERRAWRLLGPTDFLSLTITGPGSAAGQLSGEG